MVNKLRVVVPTKRRTLAIEYTGKRTYCYDYYHAGYNYGLQYLQTCKILSSILPLSTFRWQVDIWVQAGTELF